MNNSSSAFIPIPLNLTEAFKTINDHWSPRIAAELNGQKVILAKAKGVFDWHHHADEDELFLVHAGTLLIDFRDPHGVVTPITLEQGEMLTIPRGTEHRPRTARGADGYEEAHLVLFEPMSTVNTGGVESERTVREVPRL